LEDGVIVGAGAILLPGTYLTRGSNVPPGAVVRGAAATTKQ
jgi:acetyltransferase-like isoleucine patch superfamily enzyme